MTLDEAIQHAREVALSNAACGAAYRKGGQMMLADGCDACAEEHEQLADWLEELQRRRAAEQDSLDAMCGQIKKVIRTESDDGDWYAALLQDGSWLNFHEMNDILRRFIFDSTHAVRSYVDYTGQTIYERR